MHERDKQTDRPRNGNIDKNRRNSLSAMSSKNQATVVTKAQKPTVRCKNCSFFTRVNAKLQIVAVHDEKSRNTTIFSDNLLFFPPDNFRGALILSPKIFIEIPRPRIGFAPPLSVISVFLGFAAARRVDIMYPTCSIFRRHFSSCLPRAVAQRQRWADTTAVHSGEYKRCRRDHGRADVPLSCRSLLIRWGKNVSSRNRNRPETKIALRRHVIIVVISLHRT